MNIYAHGHRVNYPKSVQYSGEKTRSGLRAVGKRNVSYEFRMTLGRKTKSFTAPNHHQFSNRTHQNFSPGISRYIAILRAKLTKHWLVKKLL